MAENLEIKVSYVRITQYGLESHKDESLMNLNYEDRKDIKVMSFLPVKYDGVLDVSEYLDGFAILETLNLPSMMTTTMKQAKGKCPMLKEIVLISRNTFEQSLDSSAVRITAKELEGDNDLILSCYSTIDKEGMQTIVVNPVHIDNHEIVMEDKVLERLSMEHVDEYVSGERGLIKLIEEVNATIEDPRCHIEIGEDMLENLLYLFVEKGLTFEQFAIDFSKLYDKIESYKSISRTINQVSIKEEVESCIIETYQELQEVLYKGMLSDNAQKLSKLVSNVDIKAQDALVSDLSR